MHPEIHVGLQLHYGCPSLT